jgi:hypothetical protein
VGAGLSCGSATCKPPSSEFLHGLAYPAGFVLYITLSAMSRVPIYFEPHESDVLATEFQVMSGEWSVEPGLATQLATVRLSENGATCTFIPGPQWLAEGLFPTVTTTFTFAEVKSLCDAPDSYGPRSIYSHRALQAVRRACAARSAK